MKETAGLRTIGSTAGPTTGEDGVMTEAHDAMVPMAVQNDLRDGRKLLETMEPQERLAWGLDQFGARFALTTSFGIQSAVLLHMLSTLPGGDAVPVIWIDTGYLPPETYSYADQLTDQLKIRLVVRQSEMSPARMEALHGQLWESGRVEDLETYHRIRKVEPLEQALNDLDTRCWASGVRRGQTDHRRSMTALDPIRERWSLRPLLEWTQRDVYYYMQSNNLPQHPLFEQGYSTVGDWHSSGPDVGDLSGRDTRFGGLKQECGIHLPQDAVEGLMGEGI
jgi:phosphoadenosine phosphosulfate reductase